MVAVADEAAEIAKAVRRAQRATGAPRGGTPVPAQRSRSGGAGMGKTTFMRSTAGKSKVVGRAAGSSSWRVPDEIEPGLTRQDLRGVFLASCPSKVASSILQASAAVEDPTFVGSYELSPGEFGAALLRAAVVFCGKFRCALASREVVEQAQAAIDRAESLGLRPEATAKSDPRRLPFFRLPIPDFDGPIKQAEEIVDEGPTMRVN